MVQIGQVEEIVAVKELLQKCQDEGLIASWELPYENLLTRLSAAIFYMGLDEASLLPEVKQKFIHYPCLSIELNGHTLSSLNYRMTLG